MRKLLHWCSSSVFIFPQSPFFCTLLKGGNGLAEVVSALHPDEEMKALTVATPEYKGL